MEPHWWSMNTKDISINRMKPIPNLLNWDLPKMLGKVTTCIQHVHVTNILTNAGLIVIYYARIRQKNTLYQSKQWTTHHTMAYIGTMWNFAQHATPPYSPTPPKLRGFTDRWPEVCRSMTDQWPKPGRFQLTPEFVSLEGWTHTPWKINMEPPNHPFRKENDLPNLDDHVPCKSLGV